VKQFGAAHYAIAVVFGYVVSWKLLGEQGTIGLFHDWSIPPFSTQYLVEARDTFDGWSRSGLGTPVIYASEYPVTFLFAALALFGVSSDEIGKGIVFVIPALSFLTMFQASRCLGLSWSSAVVAGGFYALSPLLFNKLVSGQAAYLMGYSVLPLAVVACDRVCKQGQQNVVFVAAILALAAVEIQIGIIAIVLVAFYFAFLADLKTFECLKKGLSIAGFLALAEAPVILGLFTQGHDLAHQSQFTENLSWLDANSISPQDAVRFLGYVTGYFDRSVQRLGLVWDVASWMFLSCTAFGIIVMPRRVRLWCGIPCLLALAFVTGSKSVFGPAMVWLFVHVRAAQVFREFSHLMVIPVIAYALALGNMYEWLEHRTSNAWPRVIMIGCLATYVFPVISGDLDGWSRAFRIADDLRDSFRRFGSSPYRVAWFPIDQPLSFRGSGAGVDPMGVTPAGSIWAYHLEWPLTALDMEVRNGESNTAERALSMLGAGTAIFRKHFRSELPKYLYPDPRLLRFFPSDPFLQLPVGTKTFEDDATVAYALPNPFPRAFAAERIAYTPARLDVITRAVSLGYVPVVYGTKIPEMLHGYALFSDVDDVAAEATDGMPELEIETFASFDARKGFAPVWAWYCYRPEYADIPHGWLSIGKGNARFPIPNTIASATTIVSWLATPMGGRVRIRVGAASRIIDTQSQSIQLRSLAFEAGNVRAGDDVRIEALDADAEILIRSLHVLPRGDFRAAMDRFLQLRAGAKALYPIVRNASFHPVASGKSVQLPRLAADQRFRLLVRLCATKQGYLFVEDEHNIALARASYVPGCSLAQLGFEGSFGKWHIDTRGAVLQMWTLVEQNQYVEPIVPNVSAVFPGRMIGTMAVYPPGHHVLVLNDAANDAWSASLPAATHITTAYGANAWIFTDPPSSATVVRFMPTRIFHLAYEIGLFAIVVGIFSGLFVVRKPC
jgi:hypothetical protein